MSSRPSSRATAGEDAASSLRSSTAKRPLTKPVAPRLASSSSVTKSTPNPLARTSSTTSTSLSKPTTRPTVAASTARRPPSSTATTTTSSLHRARPSSTSVDASGDESKRDGLATRATRTSLASSTTAQRAAPITSSRTTTTAAARKPSSTTATGTLRSGVKSPVSTRTPTTTAARSTSTLASRPKVPTTSSTRSVTTTADKKRLSAVPASPAVKRSSLEGTEDKENDIPSEADEQPVLEEQEGNHAVAVGESDAEIAELKEDLKQSHEEIDFLKSQLAEVTARMEYFGKSAEDESGKVEQSLEAIRSEHAAKIEEMSQLHQAQIAELEAHHQVDLEETIAQHESEVELLKEIQENEQSDSLAELEALKDEINDLRSQARGSRSPTLVRTNSKSDTVELAELRQRLKNEKERHRIEEEHSQMKMTGILKGYRDEIVVLKEQHKEKIAEMQAKFDESNGIVRPKDEQTDDEKMAAAQSSQRAQSLQSELDALQNLKKAEAESHLQIVEELKAQMKQLDKSRTNDAAMASQSLSKLRSEHTDQIKGLEARLQYAQNELKTSSEANQKKRTDSMRKAKEELKAVQTELASTRSTHETNADALNKQIQALKKASETSDKAAKDQINNLQAKLKEATKSANTKDAENIQKISDLESQVASKVKELESLKSVQADEIAKLKAETESAHQATLEALKTSHASQIGELEEQSKSALRDLEALESANNANVEQAKAEADSTKAKALEEQATSHQSAIVELENKVSSVQKDIDDLQHVHEQQLTRLRTDHVTDKEVALDAIKSEHSRELDQIKSQSKTTDAELDALKASHASEIQKLESAAKSTAGELDTAKFQVRSLKDILQSVEKESEEKAEEHQKELEKVNDDFSKAVMKLSSQSIRISELETAYAQAVEQAKAAVANETEAALEALKQEHNEAIDTLRKDVELQHHNTLQTLRSEHKSAIDALTEEIDGREKTIDEIKTEHSRALENLRNTSQQDSAAVMEQLKTEHGTALDEMKTSLMSRHEANVKELEDSHVSKLDEHSKLYTSSMERSKAEHEDMVTTLRGELEKVREKLRDTSELDATTAKLSASEQAFTRLQAEHATSLSDMSKEHTDKVEALQKDLKVAQEKAADTTVVDALQSELAETKAKVTELATSHAEAVSSKDSEHATAIQKLQSELDEAKTAAASATQDSTRNEETKSLLDDAKRTVAELSEQYALASKEAETQRVLAENAKKELIELKRSLAEASVSSTPVSSPNPKRLNTRASLGGAGSVKSTPKSGLKASKWATEADDSPAEPATPSKSAPTEAQPVKTEKRSVAGQMAGIKEQFRVLSEMNDEMLQDHQKWARSLNHVEDDGTINIPEPEVESEAVDGEKEGETK